MQGNIVAAARWICAGMICSTLILVAGLVLATFGSALFPGLSGPEQPPGRLMAPPGPEAGAPAVQPAAAREPAAGPLAGQEANELPELRPVPVTPPKQVPNPS
jgi:hypothetical protein